MFTSANTLSGKITSTYNDFCSQNELSFADQLAVIVPAVALLFGSGPRPTKQTLSLAKFGLLLGVLTTCVNYGRGMGRSEKTNSEPILESQVGRYDRSRYANNGRPDDSYTAKAQQAKRGNYRKVIFNDGSIRFVDESRTSVPRRAELQTVASPSGGVADASATFSGLSLDGRSIIGDQTTEQANKDEREKRALGQNSPAAESSDSTEAQQSSESAGAVM